MHVETLVVIIGLLSFRCTASGEPGFLPQGGYGTGVEMPWSSIVPLGGGPRVSSNSSSSSHSNSSTAVPSTREGLTFTAPAEEFGDWPTDLDRGSQYHFNGGMIIGDHLWCSPFSAGSYLRVHRTTGEMSHIKILAAASDYAFRGSSYDAKQNMLWTAPSHYDAVVSLDLSATNAVVTEYKNFPSGLSLPGSQQWKFAGGFHDLETSLFWMVPSTASDFVMVDTLSPTVEFQSLPLSSNTELSCGTHRFAGAIFDPATRFAYSAPFQCDGFIRINVDTKSFEVFKNWPTGTGFTYRQSQVQFHNTQFDGKRVWGIPWQQSHFVHLDPETGVMGNIGEMPSGFVGGTSRFTTTAFDGRYIWCAPFDANMVVRVDTATLTVQGSSSTFVQGAYGSMTVDFEQRALWMCPYHSNSKVMRLRLATITPTEPTVGDDAAGTKMAPGSIFTPTDGGLGSGAAIPREEVTPLLGNDVEWQIFNSWPTSPSGFDRGVSGFLGAMIIGDYLWCSPHTSNSFLRVHRNTGQMSHFKVKTSTTTASLVRGSSYDEANNILWAARYNGPVIALDLNTGTSQEYSNYPADAGLSSQWNFLGGFVDAHSRLFWMVPHRAASYVMVNTTDPAAEFQSLPLSSSSGLSCGGWSGVDKIGPAVLDPAARVAYSAPTQCNGFVGVHVDHRNLTVFKNWPTGNGYTFDRFRHDFQGTQFDGQKVWGLPYRQDHWVYLDPETGVMGNIGDMPTGYTGGANRFLGASFDGRYIWAAPQDANKVMRVDTVSLTLKGIPRQVSGRFGGSAVDFEQHALWMCPHGSGSVARMQFATPTREAMLATSRSLVQTASDLAGEIPVASSFTPTDGGLGSGARMPLNEVTPLLDRGDLEWETFNDWPTSSVGFYLGTRPFLGAMIIGDYLWCSPQDSTSFLRVHRSTGQMSHFKVKTSTTFSVSVRGSSYDEANDMLWATRLDGPVIALDLDTGTSQEYTNYPATAGLAAQLNFLGSFFEPQSRLFWMVPQYATSYVMVNTTDPTAEFQSLPLSSSSELSCGKSKLGGAVLDPSARVAYSAPIQCNGFVGVHVDHRSLTVFKEWPTGNGYTFVSSRIDFHGTQFDGQKVWGVPYQQDHWVYLDPQTGVMGNIGDMPAGYTGGTYRFHAASSFDGRYIWGAPNDANMMIRVDTVSLTLKGIERKVSGWFAGSAVDFEQHALWFCPYSSDLSVVRVQFATPTRELVTASASLASPNKTVTRLMTGAKQTSATLSTTSRAGPSVSRTINITADDDESQIVRDQLSHSQEMMIKTISQEIQSQQTSSGSSSESSDRELNLAQPQNSSSPPTDSPQDLGAVTNFVEQLLDSRTVASVIVATGQASTVIAGVTVSSPLVATRAVRIGSVASILNSCSADAPDDPPVDAADAQLSYFELPFQLGSAVTIDGSKAGVALLGTTVLLVVAPWTVLLLIHRRRMVPLDTAVAKSNARSDTNGRDHDDHEDGGDGTIAKVQRKVVSVFCGMTFGYFAPAMVKYPIYFLLDKSSSPSLLVIALFCFLAVLAITAVSIYIVKTLGRHSSTEEEFGRPKTNEEGDDDVSSSVVYSSLKQRVLTVSPGYLATTGFLYDGSRDISQAYLRFYFVEEVIVSLLFGMLDGFAISTVFPQSACTGLAVAGLVVAVLHLAYVAGFRSYEDKVELLFSVLNAALLVSLTAAVLAAEVKYRSNEVPELELDIIGVLGISCFSTFFAQAVIMAILVCYRNSKKETLARQEQVEAAKARGGLINSCGQDEKDSKTMRAASIGAPSTSGDVELGTALLSVIPENLSLQEEDPLRREAMIAAAPHPLQINPLGASAKSRR